LLNASRESAAYRCQSATMRDPGRSVRLGFAVGSGEPVDLPIRHMCVTGQTQESGKTTTLEALVARSQVRAITFITKRGEGAFAGGRRLPPYFRQRRADWQYVASLIDATLGEKNKLLRAWLMKVCRTTQTLAEVLDNVREAKKTARGFSESIYTEIEGYLELVVPQLAELPPAHMLTIGAGLNVMDLSPYRSELQALVIRSVLEHVYDGEQDVVVVIPEAWEFLPEQRGSPVKAAAEMLIRKGAGLRNYMWLDSQDLAGVWKTAVRACPVMLIGVQREANEIKRTLSNIPASIAKPTAAAVAQLGLGQFVACWGKHTIPTYVQPAWLPESHARRIARGEEHVDDAYVQEARPHHRAVDRGRDPDADPRRQQDERASRATGGLEPVGSILERFVQGGQRAQAAVDALGAGQPQKGEEAMNADQEKKLDRLIGSVDTLVRAIAGLGGASELSNGPAPGPSAKSKVEGNRPTATPIPDVPQERGGVFVGAAEAYYDAFKARLLREAASDPAILEVLVRRPEIQVRVEKRTIETSGDTLRGRLALLIAEGWFDTVKAGNAAHLELQRRGAGSAKPNVYRELDKLATEGFVTKEDGGYLAVPGMKRNIVEVS